jgi:hypothetical protein
MTACDKSNLLERHIERYKLDVPYIGILERVAHWAKDFVAEDLAGNSGAVEMTNLRRSLDRLAVIAEDRYNAMKAAQAKYAALDAREVDHANG